MTSGKLNRRSGDDLENRGRHHHRGGRECDRLVIYSIKISLSIRPLHDVHIDSRFGRYRYCLLLRLQRSSAAAAVVSTGRSGLAMTLMSSYPNYRASASSIAGYSCEYRNNTAYGSAEFALYLVASKSHEPLQFVGRIAVARRTRQSGHAGRSCRSDAPPRGHAGSVPGRFVGRIVVARRTRQSGHPGRSCRRDAPPQCHADSVPGSAPIALRERRYR